MFFVKPYIVRTEGTTQCNILLGEETVVEVIGLEYLEMVYVSMRAWRDRGRGKRREQYMADRYSRCVQKKVIRERTVRSSSSHLFCMHQRYGSEI